MMSFTIASTNKLTNAKINHSQLFKNIVKKKKKVNGGGPGKRRKTKQFEQDQDSQSLNAYEDSKDKH